MDSLAQKKIKVGNNMLHWYFSPGQAATIVLLHDAFSCAREFEEQLTGDFGRFYQLIAVDLPGHGQSMDVEGKEVNSIQAVASLLAKCLNSVGVSSCFVVGTGTGAHIALALMEYITVKGLLMVGTVPNDQEESQDALAHVTKVSEADVLEAFVGEQLSNFPWLQSSFLNTNTAIANALRMNEKTLVQTLENSLEFLPVRGQIGVIYGALDPSLCMHRACSVSAAHLWRSCLGVIPSATHLVSLTAPDAFQSTITQLVLAVNGTTAPTHEHAAVALSSNTPAGLGGKMPNVMARYEGTSEEEANFQVSNESIPNAQNENPYARGKVPSGTMPHPSMRFENPHEEDGVFKKPPPPNSEMANNPNARGRIIAGTMPHPSSRFETVVTGTSRPPKSKNNDLPKNPNARGRVVGGTMPHPSSRFENAVHESTGEHKVEEVNVENPYARGRVPSGQLPHPSLRFEQPHHPIDRPSTRVRQPPGGITHNIFG
eukprot:m.34855 g.34855  ORF g.34855 m.34855 type:complete len:486 (+) comp9959_c0_seq1:55-1512(+)